MIEYGMYCPAYMISLLLAQAIIFQMIYLNSESLPSLTKDSIMKMVPYCLNSIYESRIKWNLGGRSLESPVVGFDMNGSVCFVSS